MPYLIGHSAWCQCARLAKKEMTPSPAAPIFCYISQPTHDIKWKLLSDLTNKILTSGYILDKGGVLHLSYAQATLKGKSEAS
jgi:hypothetical protein